MTETPAEAALRSIAEHLNRAADDVEAIVAALTGPAPGRTSPAPGVEPAPAVPELGRP
jgi:hypothetical protein